MKDLKRLLPLAFGLFLSVSESLFADYTLVLKNGRRITVQSYREEGGMIKFPGLGGEIGIGREQVQSILKAGESESRGMSVLGTERAAPRGVPTGQETKPEPGKVPAGQAKAEAKDAGAGQTQDKVLSPEEEKAKEEKEFQSKVKQLTEQIKAARDRFATSTRGSSGPEPTLLNTEEAIRARTDDLTTRLRDAGLVPGLRPGATTPGVEVPLPGYSGTQKELSDLRNQVNQLSKEREGLIEQMKQKNFDTGSLFLE